MVTLAAGVDGLPDWVTSIGKVVIGGIVLIAVLNFLLSLGGPKDRD